MKEITKNENGNKHSTLDIPGANDVMELAETHEGRQHLRRVLATSSIAAAFWMLESASHARDKKSSGWENLAAQSSTAVNSALRALEGLDKNEPRKKGGVMSIMEGDKKRD